VSLQVECRNGKSNNSFYCSYTPQPNDDESYLVCLARHDTYEGALAASVKLILEYAPKVSVTINSSSKLREGGRAMLSCVVDAKPIESVRITWKKDGTVIRGAQTDVWQFMSRE
jgi:hypothetical protein